MDVKTSALFAEMQSMATQARSSLDAGSTQQAINPSTQDFANMLGNAINNVNDLQMQSKDMVTKFEMGDKNVTLSDVMIAKEKSGIAFEATVQVRNKVMEAYKTIMNLSV